MQPASSSLSNGTDNASQYCHVLSSKAISPQMDLVAIISRDVAAPSTNSAVDAASLLPPPPPGMSAVANQARMRMLMMARARALAAGGKGIAPSVVETPKVTKCPSMRLSLWRMAASMGEQGSRVWDVEIKIADYFEDLGKDVKENESMKLCAMSWSPDCRSIALTVEIIRSNRDQKIGSGHGTRRKRFLVLYAMQDGKQERLVTVPVHLEDTAESSQLFGMIWRQLSAMRDHRPVSGSAEYVLQRMESLPEISSVLEEKEGKNKQRQRAMNAMRGGPQKQGVVDLKIDEMMQIKTDEWSVAVLNHPRKRVVITPKGQDTVSRTIMCVYDAQRIHFFLDATIYLGSIVTKDKLQAIEFEAQKGDIVISSTNSSDSTISSCSLTTSISTTSTRFSSALHLVSLSTMSYDFLVYFHDALIDIRNLYRSMHINCITPWIQKGKVIERKYSTHYPSEMQMLLLTSTANEAITSILVGNEAMTEGDLDKLRVEIAPTWNKIEVLLDAMLQAMQRLSIVFKEVKGCGLWQERYGDFISTKDCPAISNQLDLISQAQGQCFTLLRHAQQEVQCWSHFYRWFKYERTRQEALRDQIPEPKSDVAFDVLLIVEFLKRGFVNYAFEDAIGIVLDKKTRGTFVEDEDEEVQEESVMESPSVELEGIMKEKAVGELQESKDNGNTIRATQSIEELMTAKLKELQQPPELTHMKKKAAPSKEDILVMRSSPYLLTGPIAGLSKRQKALPKCLDMMKLAREMLGISSEFFSQAVSRFAKQQKPRQEMEMFLETPLTPFRSDALISTNKIDTKGRGDDKKLQSIIDEENNRQYLIGIQASSGSDSLLIITFIDRVQLQTRITEAECQGQIIDIGFYSKEEVILLFYDGQKTKMISIQLDQFSDMQSNESQKVIVAQRSYELQLNESSQRPTQLALNHAKEVAATLDEHGKLVYYDLVDLEQTQNIDEDMG